MAFYWTDFCVNFPFIGTIARNSKNFEAGRPGWMNAEEKLCNKYKKYVSQLPKAKFLERIEYMKHSGDLGRTPMSTGMTIFLFLLVAAESMGFSYLLGTWAASDGSANLYTQLMYGIVFVLASILAMVTHAAGSQFYRTSLIRSCFARYKERGSQEFHSSRVISLSDDQFSDAKDAPETRCINRIINNPHDMGSYGWSWVAGIFVAIIFVLSGVMRFSHMEAERALETKATASASSDTAFSAKNSLPPALTAPQGESDKKADAEISSSNTVEGGAAIIILGIIFVVTQIVGFGAGHKYCFAGKETYKKAAGSNSFWWWSDKDGAYADTWGYSTHDSYWEAMQPMKSTVNSRLKELQQRLKKNSSVNLVLVNTFDEYLAMEATKSRKAQVDHDNTCAAVPTSAVAAVSVAETVSHSPLAQAQLDIEAITDKAEQQAFFAKLPAEVREALKPWLKQRKEKAAAAVAVSKAELEDLF